MLGISSNQLLGRQVLDFNEWWYTERLTLTFELNGHCTCAFHSPLTLHTNGGRFFLEPLLALHRNCR